MLRYAAFVLPLMLAALVAPAARASDGDVERARVLDQQGVRAYREERYNDAIRFFEEARKLGGPPSEVWNIAKCHVRLDEPEEAAKSIEEYLGQKGLTPADRAEAEQQLREIQHRHSTLTVETSPAGATVYLEGHRWAGVTPATLDIPPGEHKVTIEQAGYDSYERPVTAKYGRAIILEARLSKNDRAPSTATPVATRATTETAGTPAHGGGRTHLFVVDGEIGVTLPQYGAVGGSASGIGFLHAGYVVVDDPRYIVTLGVRAMLTEDGWSNTQNLPNTAANCGSSIPSDESATAFSLFFDGGAAWRASPRWRLGGDLGLGIATYGLGEAGGDVFVGTCRPSPGVKPAAHLGLEASYALSRELRLLFTPFYLEAQPAFDGTRSAPKDAASMWLRLGAAAGLAFDLF